MSDKRQTVVFRADGGTTLGMGHVMRCLALAEMLKAEFCTALAIQQPDANIYALIEPQMDRIISLPVTNDFNKDVKNFAEFLRGDEMVVLDGYNFRTDYQKSLLHVGCTLIAIDDLHAWHHLAHAVINHAQGVSMEDYSVEDRTRLYLGMNYALLRSEFLQMPIRNKEIDQVAKVFVSMGAADSGNNTVKVATALLKFPDVQEINLMVSGLNPHLHEIELLSEIHQRIHIHYNLSATVLAELLRSCDLAVCPASTISLECCAVNIGLITGYTASNQLGILQGISTAGAAEIVGDFNALSSAQMERIIDQYRKNLDKANEQIKRQRVMIDGQSPKRLLNLFKELQHV